MVTSTTPPEESPQESHLDEPDPDVDAGLPPLPDDTGDVGDVGAPRASVESEPPPDAPSGEAQTPPLVASETPQPDQKMVEEVHQRRSMEEAQKWRDQVGQTARSYEQTLTQSGYTPAMARDQARRYVQQEQKFRQQDEEAARLLGFVEGRQMAAVHYLGKHGLANKQVLEDLKTLQQADTPAAMEKEAKRMKDDRALRAENARLKQGSVPPQAFDNSQGAAEVTSNDARLMQAYIDGDRSEAATAAVRRKVSGS
jgi:hypothetical protein